MKKSVLILCTLILGGVFFGVALCNGVNLFFNPDRPTVSVSENRALKTMPRLSFASVLDGSYTSETDGFLSDNFVFREELLSLSRKVSSYKSITVLLDMEDELVYIPVMGGDVLEKPDEPEYIEPETTEENDAADDVPEDIPSEDVPVEGDPVTDVTEEPPVEDEPVNDPPPADGPQTEPDGGPQSPVSTDEPDYSVSGYIIYKGSVYSIAYLVKSVAQQYAAAIEDFADVFPEADVYDVTVPLSAIVLTGTSLEKKINSPQKIMNTISGYFDPEKVTFVDICDILIEHKDEYLYFNSDHHWTARGAYYAYSEISSAMGITPTPITDMTEKVLTDSFKGTLYSMTQNEKVKDFTDIIYAYIPTKTHTMTVTPQSGKTYTRRSSVMTYKNYSAFIEGDNPLTVIETPDSPQDKVVLVIKDSFGNAFVPYLTEIFGKIIVVDPRYYNGNVAEDLASEGITDIIFINNAYNSSTSSWVKNIKKLIGK